MADVADDADIQQANAMNILLKVRKPVLPYIGECYNCGEPVPNTHKFCDGECQEDYEHIQKMRCIGGRNG